MTQIIANNSTTVLTVKAVTAENNAKVVPGYATLISASGPQATIRTTNVGNGVQLQVFLGGPAGQSLLVDAERALPHRHQPEADKIMNFQRDDREQLFGTLNDPTTTATFFDRVADDVDWTVKGTHPVAGRYTDKKTLLAGAIGRLNPLTRDGTRLEVRYLAVDGYTVVAEIASTCTGVDGGLYNNALCWVCRFDSTEPGAKIVEVREYVDSAMITWMVERNENTSA